MFLFGKIAFLLVKPSSLLLIALVAGALGAGRRWGRSLIIGVATVLVLLVITQAGQRAVELVEQPYAEVPLPPAVDGIIVLGGRGVITRGTFERGQWVIDHGVERQLAPLALLERYPDAQLVFTGGIASPGERDLSEAAGAEALWRALGLDVSRVIFERRAYNTATNASYTLELVDVEPDENWLLVTSASHMWRSLATFRAAGWPVIPHSVDFGDCQANRGTWFLSADLGRELRCLDLAAREMIGIVAYRFAGHIDEWRPDPYPRSVAPAAR